MCAAQHRVECLFLSALYQGERLIQGVVSFVVDHLAAMTQIGKGATVAPSVIGSVSTDKRFDLATPVGRALSLIGPSACRAHQHCLINASTVKDWGCASPLKRTALSVCSSDICRKQSI